MAAVILGSFFLALHSLLVVATDPGLAERADWPLPHEDAEHEARAEDHAVVLLQDVHGVSLMRKQVAQMAKPDAIGAFDDASSLAQTQLEVRPASAVDTAPGATAEAEAAPQPLWKGEDAAEEHEDMCSAEGLSPGVCAMAALARAGSAQARGSPQSPGLLDFFRPERLERALFSEIESALSGSHAGISSTRLSELQKELGGLFASLPKNSAGLLGSSAVRYLLHQHFLRQHAWYVRSLNPAGEAQAPASESEELRGRVPRHLQELIESRQGGLGLGLKEVAALVATLDHLIQGDMVERLKAAYASHGLASNGMADRAQVGAVLETFMAHFLSLEHRSGYAISPEQARKEKQELAGGYQGWPMVEDFIEAAVLKQSSMTSTLRRPSLAFAHTLIAAKDVMRRFAGYSVEECRGVKRSLSGMPGGASGRVRLSDFHQEAVDGQPIFSESTEYLSKLGALDNATQAGPPFVLVPNYVYSPSNCVGTTSFFDMCCRNECETILEDLEHALQQPTATSSQVLDALTSRSGGFGEPARQELEKAAQAAGGAVSLHGLAFAQWLHHAFPLECPRPRPGDYRDRAGHTAELPDAGSEFQAVAEVQITASKAELLQELHGNATATAFPEAKGMAGMEELRAAAAAALGPVAATGGLKVSPLRDATSLAQAGIKVAPAPTGERKAGDDGAPQEVKQVV